MEKKYASLEMSLKDGVDLVLYMYLTRDTRIVKKASG